MDMNSLAEKIVSCTLCDLSLSRTHAVPGEGPAGAKIFLVGEAPGRDEDATGRPFVGRAGKLLDRALYEAGIRRSEVFITSVVKCRPPDNRRPNRSEMQTCLPYLRRQIQLVDPRIICLMGNVASAALLGKQGVTALRGRVFEDRYLITYHPAAVLRNPNRWEEFVSDLRTAKEL
jgi:uracil-DNA glycosylase family 4